MKKVLILFIIMFIINASLYSSGTKDIEPILSGNEAGSYKILILVELSKYRFALTQSIENNLNKDDRLFITIDDLGSYKHYEIDNYTAVILINAGKMLNVDGNVKKILKQSKKKKIIVMTTWGSSHLPPDIGVDSISAASAEENIKEMTEQVLSLLEKYIQ